MAYIGNPPANRFVAPKAASVFSGDGSTTAFTLDHAVGSDEDILVSVDGVIQEPSVAYAVSSGTTLTFTAAPSSNSGNNIFVYYLFRTVGTVSHPSNNALQASDITVDTTTLVTDSTNNRVGIGIASPSTALHVRGADDTDTLTVGNTTENTALTIRSLQDDRVVIAATDGGTNRNMSFETGTTERMRINTDGNILVGRTSELNDFGDGRTSLVLQGTGSQDYSTIQLGNNGTASNTQILGLVGFYDGTNENARFQAQRDTSTDSANLLFFTRPASGSNTERARLDGSGRFFVGTSTTTLTDTAGLTVQLGGSGNTIGLTTCSQIGGVAFIANRNSDDGTVIQIRQANATEGTINVSGSTVSYNAFSGSHWSRLTDNSKPTILKGTVIETIDEMCDWYRVKFTVAKTEEKEEYIESISIALPNGKKEGDTISYTHEGITYDDAVLVKENDNKHTKCKISETADSKRVYGVFADWDNDDDTVNDMYVTALGTHVVRINKDVTVQAGDLLSSNGDGTAKVQDDDIIRSKTIGKVLTNIKQETYSDGSYTVPCALYCG